MTTRRHLIRGALVAAALGLAAPFLSTPAPAQAAATCWSAGTDGAHASANCSGYGYARLIVQCHAIWPFSPWTDYGAWVWVGGAATIVNAHVHCAAPITVSVQYR
ncbi:hypothetical protein OH146_12775 [Salinibacterium sp. SYSU T00001]|uniref:hypothetical protein n=1 Tax=Homoserinimonas sedimenticola TaxID=2986805 RepID=UPI002236B23E|nr:hypothetical protein [Salinibacterium sedimenticola]MCW4386648.1 hypothetical protein [Salinibacterium sedimenticola]